MAADKDTQKLIETLHPLEQKVLPLIAEHNSLAELVDVSGLSQIEVMRALQWLENKDIAKIKTEPKEKISLDANGKEYLEKGLPEKRFLIAIKDKPQDMGKIAVKAGLDKSELNACIGILKGKAAINFRDNKIELTAQGKNIIDKESIEDKFLKKLSKGSVALSRLSDEERFAYDIFRKRKEIIKTTFVKDRTAELTELGKKLSKMKIKTSGAIDRLTPDMLKNGAWKGRKFRRYDVEINVPKIYGGKKHQYNEFINEVKHILLRMGFVEMTGPIIETEFFNFDALYQPQNHPARTWTATYKIKEPKYGDLPDKKIIEAVSKTHENGGDSGSTGWGYKWDPKIAMQLMPRAHDTAISPRYMAKEIKSPGKYFSLVRCFRPDVIDATHGVEFNQMGGFVIGKDLSFKHLLGLLRDCAFELTGATEARFFPDYFPFTEPSVQISVKHPKFGWLELAGAGIFRPELCTPLGIKEPVIAWGFGLDRLAMLKLGIKDIRDIFSHDLDYLKKQKKYNR